MVMLVETISIFYGYKRTNKVYILRAYLIDRYGTKIRRRIQKFYRSDKWKIARAIKIASICGV